MKIFIGILLGLLISTTGVFAADNLWEFYTEQGLEFPSVQERAQDALSCGIDGYVGLEVQNERLLMCLQGDIDGNGLILGANLPIAGTTYNLAGSGTTGSATSITLRSLTLPQTGQKLVDGDFSDLFYITLEPGNRTRQEIVACTTITQNSGGDATLSGCSRGMAPISPYTASSTLEFAHGGGTQVIFSDPPQLFREYASKDNTETITNVWTFNVLPKFFNSTDNPSSSDQLTPKFYVDAQVNQGAATSTEETGGISELATTKENASSTVATADKPLVQQSQHSSSTPSANILTTNAGIWDIWSENDGKLAQGWLDLTEAYTWTGLHTFVRTTSSSATTTKYLQIGSNFSLPAAFDFNEDLSVSGDLVVAGTVTSTRAIDFLNFCFNGTNCRRDISRVSTSSPKILTTGNASTTFSTFTFTSADMEIGDVYSINYGGNFVGGGNADVGLDLVFNSLSKGIVFSQVDDGTIEVDIEIVFGNNNEVAVYGIGSIFNADGNEEQEIFNISTTTVKYTTEDIVIDLRSIHKNNSATEILGLNIRKNK